MSPRAWPRDPVVLASAAFGVAATAWALWGGRYLPGIDYSNHLGLISVLAHGGESGALDYLHRSFAPSHYLLFYALTALLAQILPVDVASKVVLALSAGGLTLATASLAEACGRSPRAGALAPLAMFGVSFGYGFVTFIFTAPLFVATLAAAERCIAAPAGSARRATVIYAIVLCLTYLGHGMLFLTAALMLVIRVAVLGIYDLARGGRTVIPRLGVTVLRLAAGALPVLLLVVPSALQHAAQPAIEEGTQLAPNLFGFEPWSSHAAQIGGHLLERGSSTHWSVMYATLALFALACAGAALLRRRDGHDEARSSDAVAPASVDVAPAPVEAPADSRRAIAIYAALLVALFLFGPMSIEWPSQVWFVYPRYGVLAGIAVWLVPRVPYRGVFGGALVAISLALVGWNAHINRGHIERFSSWAANYDSVRKAVPPRTRVLALTVVGGGDLTQMHPALGSLYFYHLVDGASYTAFLFDHEALPVYSRRDVKKPNAPFWRSPDSFDPGVHGVEFDYLVLRGAGLIARTQAAQLHELVADVEGWHVFRTKSPVPRPQPTPAS